MYSIAPESTTADDMLNHVRLQMRVYHTQTSRTPSSLLPCLLLCYHSRTLCAHARWPLPRLLSALFSASHLFSPFHALFSASHAAATPNRNRRRRFSSSSRRIARRKFKSLNLNHRSVAGHEDGGEVITKSSANVKGELPEELLSSPPKVDSEVEVLHEKVTKQIIKEGNGQKPSKYSTCFIHYRAWSEGVQHKFEDTWQEQRPIEMVLKIQCRTRFA